MIEFLNELKITFAKFIFEFLEMDSKPCIIDKNLVN